MTDGYALVLIFLLCLLFGRLSGIRTQLKRIADVAEGAEKRVRGAS